MYTKQLQSEVEKTNSKRVPIGDTYRLREDGGTGFAKKWCKVFMMRDPFDFWIKTELLSYSVDTFLYEIYRRGDRPLTEQFFI